MPTPSGAISLDPDATAAIALLLSLCLGGAQLSVVRAVLMAAME